MGNNLVRIRRKRACNQRSKCIRKYAYDGNGNLKTKTGAEGKVTTYTYNGLDMVTHINYNGGKEVSYQYNKVGDLKEMNDWTGRTTFEVDLLNRITKTTDTKGKAVEYTYERVSIGQNINMDVLVH